MLKLETIDLNNNFFDISLIQTTNDMFLALPYSLVKQGPWVLITLFRIPNKMSVLSNLI